MKPAGLGSTPSVYNLAQEQTTSQQPPSPAPPPPPIPHTAMSQMSSVLCAAEPGVDGSAALASDLLQGPSTFLNGHPLPLP